MNVLDCETGPDELETLCFQPSGYSVRTWVTYGGGTSGQSGMRNGLFVGGDPINYVDPTGEVRWGQLGRGIASIAGGVLGTVALGSAEVGSGGLATAGVVLAGTSVAGAYTYGIGNVVAAFAPDAKQAALMEGAPSSLPQLVARGVGGEPAQNAVGVVESMAELNAAKTGLEVTKAAVETADAEKSLIDSLNEANKEKKSPCNK